MTRHTPDDRPPVTVPRHSPRRRALGALAILVATLAACAAPNRAEVDRRRVVVTDPMPPMKLFGAGRTTPPQRSNAEHVQDFLDLAFALESGRALPVLTRFEQPVTVRMIGPVPPSAARDMAALLERLRTEAGIDIRRVPASQEANLTVDFVPRARLQRQVPRAACFVVPNVDGWRGFMAARHSARLDWAAVDSRERAAMFIPTDTSPQEVRDCLHEELAQALGPLNDLYRLPDSVFNDDNFHTVLTGFDMLMLRAFYAPELANGMTRSEVAARLPGVMTRLNPAGNMPPTPLPRPTPGGWIDAIGVALGPDTPSQRRRDAAAAAVRIAIGQGWRDARMAFSWYALGRLALVHETETALVSFQRAAAIYRTLPDSDIHLAHIAMQMAAFALATGQPARALEEIDRALIPVAEAQNAALLASLLMLKATALESLDRRSEARVVRLDSLGWARYGFGTEEDVRARLSEIAILSPRRTGERVQ
mgnify:CR=1 FL=1